MLNSKTIGCKILEARKVKNLSQAELAQQVSISSQAVGKWERGESMPDIVMLNRLAEILGVDLNYFSESFKSADIPAPVQIPSITSKKKMGLNWNMSSGNWIGADFSGLENLKEKFSTSNMKNCIFIQSDFSELTLQSNNIEGCDFSGSDFRNSSIKTSNIQNNDFSNCSIIDAAFFSSEIKNCNFSNADLSGAEFSTLQFENNIVDGAVWRLLSFRL